MANDLVVTLGARLDKFAADLDQAGNMADSAVSRIENSFAGLNPGINLGALASGGALAALTGLMAALKGINSEMAELAKNAEYAGVSVARFQELRFAATQGGVGSQAATDDLRSMAKLLADAKVNENSLTKLLDENNIKYKDRNGEVIKLNQALTITGDLLKRFNSMPEKVEAARMLGLSEDWVKALRNGGAAFNDVAASAEAAGAVIDSQTIAKAAAFDDAWKKSSALLSMQMKAVTADVAGWLDDLIDKAGAFIAELTKGQAPGTGQTKFNATADAMAVAAKEAAGLAQDVDQLTRVIDNMVAKGGDPDIIRGLKAARVEAQGLALDVAKAQIGAAMTDFPGGKVPLPGARPEAANKPTGDASLPSRAKGGDTADEFDRATKSIDKHTTALEAQKATLGETAFAQEEFRVQLALSEALVNSGKEINEEYATSIAQIAERAARAKQALADAQFQMAKINQTGQVLGSAISTAFTDAIIEGKKLDEVLKGLVNTLLKAAMNATIMSLFTPGAGGAASPFASLFKAAGGTDYAPGGFTMVGEKGPELVNLPRGSQVIPNDALRSGMSGNSIVYSPAIDARGASVEAVTRLAQIMEEDRATFATRTVATIQQARRARMPGV